MTKKHLLIIFLFVVLLNLIGCNKQYIVRDNIENERDFVENNINNVNTSIEQITPIKEDVDVLHSEYENFNKLIIEDIEKSCNINFEEVVDIVHENPVFGIYNGLEENSINKLYSFSINKESYEKEDTLILNIENLSSLDLIVENIYKIEALKNGNWEYVALESFELELISIMPGVPFKQEISLKDLRTGTYRISKNIFIENLSAENMNNNNYCKVEFVVK